MELTNICRERTPKGCNEIIPSVPCRYYVIQGGVKVYVEVNADEYKVIGKNKDTYFLTLK